MSKLTYLFLFLIIFSVYTLQPLSEFELSVLKVLEQQDRKLLKPFTLPKFNFTCPVIPPQSDPTNVWKLRPSDIKVVMSIGDSITAGFAMVDESFLGSFFEYRGQVATMGVDPGAVTTPNFIQKISGRTVKGGSIKRSLPWEVIEWRQRKIRPHNPPIDHLNAAQGMATSRAISAQTDYLIKQMVQEGVDVEKDWKMLTIFIGANDICVSCKRPERADEYEKALNETLFKVKSNIPRVFVNIITMFNISQVWDSFSQYTYCNFILGWLKPCPCLPDENDRKHMDNLSVELNKRIYKLEQFWNSKGYSDFGVAVQPFTMNMKINDRSIVSKLDCFHPSLKANHLLAVGLWNSMITPRPQKPTSIDETIKLKCPDMNTYLQ